MTSVLIGVHVHAEPARLRETLAALAAHTRPAHEVILLPDGPDAETRALLEELHGLRRLASDAPLGPPACFNRLVTAGEAEVYVLLESGAGVGPGWLERLLGALAGDPRHGLAGPSTNRSWNEQAALPRAGGAPEEIAATAEEARRRFGCEVRTLEPLHSLADFCYAVRRDVVEAVGAAEEAYGLGPCWEMDYNARALRAGYLGVWVAGAYVHRAPFTARRRREEARRFAAGKRLYQDRLCALRLLGERGGYEPHCRGEACEHFAPAELIRIHRPLPGREAGTPSAKAGGRPPLVSCIMPTRVERTELVLRSIEYFHRQSYPERELLIVDDGPPGLGDRLAAHLAADPRIRFLRLGGRRSIGAKRNLGCRLARGELIAHWDDDDWYGRERLARQVAPLVAGEADVSGLHGAVFFVLDRWQAWQANEELHRRLFVGDVHGGTLVFRRALWEAGARYPNASLAEDAGFLTQCLRRGARLARMSADGVFLYLRHGSNSWSFREGEFLDPAGWCRAPEPPLPAEDRAFYAARSPAAPVRRSAPAGVEPPPAPLVSCIMPTADRPRLAVRAVEYFLRQDYPDRELIVVDDGAEPVGELLPADPRIRYVRLAARERVGAKRNRACALARGELVVHWDDDDWAAPHRVRLQVESLLAAGAELNGLDRVIYFDPVAARAWTYVHPRSAHPWVGGNTLCYRRAFWRRHPFPAIDVGEDNRFLQAARAASVQRLDDPSFLVALIHPHNVSPKRPAPPRWQALDPRRVVELLGEDAAFYRGERASPVSAVHAG